jgi:hypothetical protein
MKRKIHFLNCVAATLLLSGCLGYQLGGSRPKGIETVTMAAIVNKTDEPAIELQVTHAMRDRIQFDGRLKLVNSAEEADGVIEIILIDYNLAPIAFSSIDKTRPDIYRLRITGIALLKNAETGEVISRSQTYGEATFPFESDLTSSKRDALPRAAAEIAKFMVDDLIETWQ